MSNYYAVKVRLKPNNKQNTKLFQYAGSAGFAYNWAIAREQANHEQGNKFTQLKKQPAYAWLSTISNSL